MLSSTSRVLALAAILALLACSDQSSSKVDVPEYVVLDIVDQISGVRYGDVLVSTSSRQTTAGQIADVLKAIAEREGLGQAILYCSRDAYEANMSSSFGKQHPDALKTCFLGSLDGALFTPGESLFP